MSIQPNPLDFILRGRGGGGGKGKGGGDEAANTLRSKARAKMIEAISEGEIGGLFDGAKSIYFDQTPVMNTDGSLNFKNVVWEEHKGLPDEQHFTGSSAVETPVSVEIQVKLNTGAVTKTIVDQNADALRVVVRLPALASQNDDSGQLEAASVHYVFEVRPFGGAWALAIDNDIRNEKTTSPYQIAHRINLPLGGCPWDVRMRRITSDSTETKLQNDTWWEGYVVLVEGKFTYPHTAAVSLEVNAEDMGQSIPARSFRVKGIKIHVPTNYDPVTRVYTGIWDGTFKLAVSDSPPWIFYDLVINDRYGLGEFVNAATIDKWSLYTIAQYCDQLVKTGFKTPLGVDIMEPRFTYNGAITSREEAYFVLQSIATAWRGMAYWSVGQVFASADMPSDPIKIVSQANVINGAFSYSGTALKARYSAAAVKWNDPADFYRPAIEVVVDNEALKKFGWRQKDVQLNGCNSRGLAHRYGKWILDTEQNETETVEFSASWDHAEMRPGHIIAVADARKAQIRTAGRIVMVEDNFVTLDAAFAPTVGENYSLMMTMVDGSLETISIAAFTGNVLTLAAPFVKETAPNAMYAIKGTDIVPRLFRVLAVDESEPNIFKITALFHDPQKFARVEENMVFDPLPYSRPTNAVYPPSNLTVNESTFVLNGQTRTTMTLSWSPSQEVPTKEYHITVVSPNGGFADLGIVKQNSVDLNDVLAGDYVFSVEAVAYSGLRSVPVTLTYTANGPEGIQLGAVANVRLVDRPDSNEFVGRDVRVAWDNMFPSASLSDATGYTHTTDVSPLYKSNTVKVYDNATNTLLRTQRVIGELYTYAYDVNVADSLAAALPNPCRSLRFSVTVTDKFDRESVAETEIFTNSPPIAIAPTYENFGSTIYLYFPAIADTDFKGILVWRSLTAGFDPLVVAPEFDTTANSLTIIGDENEDYYFRFAAYDAFGEIGLNISSEVHILTSPAGTDFIAPAVPTGLTLDSVIEQVLGVDTRSILQAEWTAPADADLAYFNVEVKQGVGNYVGFQTTQTYHEWNVLPGNLFTVRVSAVDTAGNASPMTAPVSITSDTSPTLTAQINAGSTQIDAGKILISGGTSLADWRKGGDTTKIDGGAVSANTIQANSMIIGLRNLSIEGLTFEHNSPTANKVSWTVGTINYTDDTGALTSRAITASNATWAAGTLYLYWTQGGTAILSTTALATAMGTNNVVLAAYRGGVDLVTDYGRTIIDGSNIKTGSIDTNQIKANAITSTLIAAGQITTIKMAAGAITANELAADSVTATKINVTSLSAIAVDAGTLNAGIVKSADNFVVFNLTAGTLIMSDTS